MGEAAEAMIEGEDCQVCGAYIGPGPGYPRSCAGCSGKDTGDSRWGKLRENKQRRNAQAREERTPAINALKAEGFRVHWFTPYHCRVTFSMEGWIGEIDLFPTAGKWNIPNTSKRGQANDLIPVVREKLVPPVRTKGGDRSKISAQDPALGMWRIWSLNKCRWAHDCQWFTYTDALPVRLAMIQGLEQRLKEPARQALVCVQERDVATIQRKQTGYDRNHGREARIVNVETVQ